MHSVNASTFQTGIYKHNDYHTNHHQHYDEKSGWPVPVHIHNKQQQQHKQLKLPAKEKHRSSLTQLAVVNESADLKKKNTLFSSSYNLNTSVPNTNELASSNSASNLMDSNTNKLNDVSNNLLLNNKNKLSLNNINKDDKEQQNELIKSNLLDNSIEHSKNLIETNVKSNSQNSSNQQKLQKQHSYYKVNRIDKFKAFWRCTKPCGILTLVFGILLLGLSLFGFYFLFDTNLCKLAHVCENGILQISSVSFLVIGIVVVIIGLVIAIYSNKDHTTQVIIATGKHFENLSLSDNNNNNNTNLNTNQRQFTHNNSEKLTQR